MGPSGGRFPGTSDELADGCCMNCRQPMLACGTLLAFSTLSAAQSNSPATYTLKATPKTVAWGYYDAKAAPVLRVKSGDTVEIETLITNSPKRLEEAGDRKSTRLNSSHIPLSRMPSSA